MATELALRLPPLRIFSIGLYLVFIVFNLFAFVEVPGGLIGLCCFLFGHVFGMRPKDGVVFKFLFII